MPTSGKVDYTLIGATKPSVRVGGLGSFDGSLSVAFGAQPLVGVSAQVDIYDNSYTFGTAGGSADPTNGGMAVAMEGDAIGRFFSYNLVANGSGSICGGQCSAVIVGFLAGDGGKHAGFSYTFGSGGAFSQVDGVAAFAAPGATATVSTPASSDWSTWTGANTNIAAGVGKAAGIGSAPRTNGRLDNGMNPADRLDTIKEWLGANFSFQ